MKEKGRLYYTINAIVLATSMLILFNYIYRNIDTINIQVSELVIYLILFIALNIVKYVKTYFIFLEEKMSLKKYTKLYMKTTFVNIMIPFKLGEIFRMYCFGKEIGNYQKGIVGILLDRFVDTVMLLIILIPTELKKNGEISIITLSLLLFILLFTLFIIVVPSTYKYLNKFLIINKPNKISLYLLKILEKVNEIYQSGMQLLKGRIIILATLSVLSWLIDFGIIRMISLFKFSNFDISVFIEYLTSAVYQYNSVVLVNYMVIVTVTFALVIGAIYMAQCIKKIGGVK